MRIDESELDRAVANVAAQNQLTPAAAARAAAQGRHRVREVPLQHQGPDDGRADARARGREPDPGQRRRDRRPDRGASQRPAPTPSSTSPRSWCWCPTTPPRRWWASGASVALAALRRVRGGEDFATVAREMSQDGNRAAGGEIGMRPTDRLPDVFVKAVRPLKSGEVSPDAAAQRRRLSRAQADRAQGRGRLQRPAGSRPPHPAAALDGADRRGGGAPAGPVPARDPGRRQELRAARPRELGGLERRAGRRPRLGLGRLVRARIRGGARRARHRRHLRAGGDALRRAPRSRWSTGARSRSTPSSSASRRGTSCASRSSRRPIVEWLRDLRGRAYIELREPPQ